MDINEIKKLIRSENDRIIIVDANGNPEFVISAYPGNPRQDQATQDSQEECHECSCQKDQAGRLTIEDLPYL